MKREWRERQKETKMNEDALIERKMKWKRNEKSVRDESKTWNTWWLLFGKEYFGGNGYSEVTYDFPK